MNLPVRSIATAALVVLTIQACGTRNAARASADSTAIVAAAAQYRQAWLTGDTAMALGVVSDDIRLMLPGAPDVRGQEGARIVFAEEMRDFKIPALTVNRQELIVQGDHAIDIGTYEETLVPKTGATINARGRYLVVWRREPGGWRMWRYIINEFAPVAPAR
jgi:ketosteroid isomerase-like protein